MKLVRMSNRRRYKYYYWECSCGYKFHTKKLLPYDVKDYKKLIIRNKI